jgi:hypothetical protein
MRSAFAALTARRFAEQKFDRKVPRKYLPKKVVGTCNIVVKIFEELDLFARL